jgi:hypothetical protein
MGVLELLDRPIAYHRVFVTLTGSVKAAVMLSQAVYWQKRARQADGWWYKSAEEWEDETGLTRREQETARKDCEKFLKSALRGIPATLFWRVDQDALDSAIREIQFSQNVETSFDESAKLDSTKAPNINRNTETTHRLQQEGALFENANRTMDAILENEKNKRYPNRDKIPPEYLGLCDTYNALTGQEPSKRVLVDWLGTFAEMVTEGIGADDLTAAHAMLTNRKDPILIARPGSLTNTAAAIRAKRKATGAAVKFDPMSSLDIYLEQKEG